MRKILAVLAVILAFGLFSSPAFSGKGTVLSKGNQTVVVYQSQSNPNRHWTEIRGNRVKRRGSAAKAVQTYVAQGFKVTGSKSW